MSSLFYYWPHDREGTEPRMQQYRVVDLGLPLLHGHTNSEHVGWDAWGGLVPQEVVMEWLRTTR